MTLRQLFIFGGILLAEFLVIVAIFWAVPAQAAPQCGDHQSLLAFVGGKYGEIIDKSEIAYDAGKIVGLVEWTENVKTGTWSLLMTEIGTGRTCLLWVGDTKAGDGS